MIGDCHVRLLGEGREAIPDCACNRVSVPYPTKEYCKRAAYCVIQSNDLVAYEDLKGESFPVKSRRKPNKPELG